VRRGTLRASVLVCALAVGALAGTLALAGGGEHDARARTPAAGDPGRFLVKMIEEKTGGRYADAWTNLYPFHQSVAPLGSYIRCEAKMPFPGRLVAVRVMHKEPARVSIAGLPAPVPGEAVTIRAIVRSPQVEQPVVVVHTFHAVPVRGRWTWILSPSRFDLYRSGGCWSHAAL
jgi:hypothetical protein